MFFIFLLVIFPLGEGAGVLDAAEQYIEMTKAAYPKEREKIEAAASELANPLDYPSDYTPHDNEEFHFIIIGGGSAGLVVLNRLTEVTDWKVLLIEAGGDPIKSMEVPSLLYTYTDTKFDWSHRNKPDGKSCLGMNNQECIWVSGKGLGGTSSFIFTVYERGNRRDYDQWEAEGCTGWGYKNVLQYFKKSEDMRSPEVLAYSPEYHSTGGYLGVEEYPSFAHERFYEKLIKGMKDMGYDSKPDVNGANQTGMGRIQETLKDGRRCSTAKCFLSPIRSRTNIKVTKNSLATKIIFDKNKKAYGVELMKNGTKRTVRCSKEIVLSAGAINSPQILMLSGVGPREHLEKMNIDVVADLPVGANFQDHPFIIALALTTNHTDISTKIEEEMYKFLMKKPSTFSHLSSLAHLGFITLSNNPDWPDCEFGLISLPKNSSAAVKSILGGVNIREDIQKHIIDLNLNNYISFLFLAYLRPNGRGEIELNSTNPLEYPNINHGFFSDENDIEGMLKYFEFTEAFANTPSMRSLDAKLYDLKATACDEIYKYKSREHRICSLRHFTSTSLHPAGTCKMGASEDPSAVVDPLLRVKGSLVSESSTPPSCPESPVPTSTHQP